MVTFVTSRECLGRVGFCPEFAFRKCRVPEIRDSLPLAELATRPSAGVGRCAIGADEPCACRVGGASGWYFSRKSARLDKLFMKISMLNAC